MGRFGRSRRGMESGGRSLVGTCHGKEIGLCPLPADAPQRRRYRAEDWEVDCTGLDGALQVPILPRQVSQVRHSASASGAVHVTGDRRLVR